MWWLIIGALVVVVAAIVVAHRRGTHASDRDTMRVAGNGEHMFGVEMSRHHDSGGTGAGF
ncbi:hypothetical protein [uncultured Phycicoccus sp.]|uniref:hypothetical protein n=1 Tax=uncultured Phycicoccus sp. TaxID=661422 RepID=UPI00262EF6F2|nr:hypothetical protein [uncultured Phycicoccus sp.]